MHLVDAASSPTSIPLGQQQDDCMPCWMPCCLAKVSDAPPSFSMYAILCCLGGTFGSGAMCPCAAPMDALHVGTWCNASAA
jgi:hypothetical protein